MEPPDQLTAALAAIAGDARIDRILEETGRQGSSKLRTLIAQSLSGQPVETAGADREESLRLLRAAIIATRRIGRLDAEVALLERHLALNPAPFVYRQLSLSHAVLGNYGRSREMAERALEAQPDAVSTQFQGHLEDLEAAGKFETELRTLARQTPKFRPERSDRVAYCLHNALPNAQGGYALRSHALATAIGEAGRELVAFARPGFPTDGKAYDGEPVERAEIDGVEYRYENSFGRRGRSFGYILEAADYFQRAFEAEDIGIVHAATNFWVALPAGIAARRSGLPFLYEVRSFWSVTREAAQPGFRDTPLARREDALEAITLSLADRLMALNGAMADFVSEFGADPARATIAPNCVDAERFAPGPRDPDLADRYEIDANDIVVGYLGALREYEGLDVLAAAVSRLANAGQPVKLLIFGAAPGTTESALTETIGDNTAIRLLPPVPPDQTPALYRLFDICAYPRRSFAVTELVSPLKPLEAMASGKAVVISDVGGMRDLVVDEETGLVCPSDDVDALADAIARLANDGALRERLGRAARDFAVAERNWNRAASTVLQLYDEVGKATGGRTPSLSAAVDALFGVKEGT